MIEQVIYSYLAELFDDGVLKHPIFMEMPEDAEKPSDGKYYLMEKTGSGQNDRLFNSTLAIQSYAPNMYGAAELNEEIKKAMLNAIILKEVTRVRVNSDYNYTDTQTKEYRYQAVFDLVHY